MYLGKDNILARQHITIKQGDELSISINGRRFIIRGIGPDNSGGVQIFGKDYLTEDTPHIYAGTTSGIVVGTTFAIGYEEDIKVKIDKTIQV